MVGRSPDGGVSRKPPGNQYDRASFLIVMPRNRKADVPTAAPFVPSSRNLSVLKSASRGCRGCDLWKLGTQTVFGEGKPRAKAMFVGEQPGDREDLAGKPF